nr:methylesterase 10 [Quercus suber]
MGDDVKHFVLVHGVCHGSWCWYRLIALFKQAGHRVTALDLGACGINPKELNDITSIWDYVHSMMEFMASLPQVHGVCHGSWCWYRLIALFKQAGHRVTALDLGACGINPKELNDITSIWDYVHSMMEFMAFLPQGESVILVGHSYAGC